MCIIIIFKVLLDLLFPFLEVDFDVSLITLPAKKWHWRARVSSLQVMSKIPEIQFTHLLTSSTFPLAEFLGIMPRFHQCKKIIYFHENQLVYPVQRVKERDIQYGYNQIMAAISADCIIFNSEWNRKSFLENISRHLKLIPDFKPINVATNIDSKCRCVYSI